MLKLDPSGARFGSPASLATPRSSTRRTPARAGYPGLQWALYIPASWLKGHAELAGCTDERLPSDRPAATLRPPATATAT